MYTLYPVAPGTDGGDATVSRLLETVITELPLMVKVPGSSPASCERMLGAARARKSLIGSAAEAQNAALLVHDRFIQKSRLTSTRFRNLSRGESGRGGPGARGDLRVHTFSRSDSRPGAPPARLNSPVALWRVREYLIAYAPEEQPLLVIAILHGRRSPRVMAAILRGR